MPTQLVDDTPLPHPFPVDWQSCAAVVRDRFLQSWLLHWCSKVSFLYCGTYLLLYTHRACLAATIRSSGASQSTIKLVATNLIANARLMGEWLMYIKSHAWLLPSVSPPRSPSLHLPRGCTAAMFDWQATRCVSLLADLRRVVLLGVAGQGHSAGERLHRCVHKVGRAPSRSRGQPKGNYLCSIQHVMLFI